MAQRSEKTKIDLSHVREEYGTDQLLESDVDSDPMLQFRHWFEEYAQIATQTHNAMVLSTVDQYNHPDSRVVLLKELQDDRFIFYTQYTSTKGLQMENNPFVALNFYWQEQARQVRVRGMVHRVDAKQSDEYFLSRPLASQFSCIASVQSEPITNREALEQAYQNVALTYTHQPVQRPMSWGGYAVVPDQIEFWQGRDNRLHDRLQYTRSAEGWRIQRLAP